MKKLLPFFIILVGLLSSCTSETNLRIPAQSELIGLASPIQVEAGMDTTMVFTPDYFMDYASIDSIKPPAGTTGRLSADRQQIDIIGLPPEPLSVLDVWIDGISYSIPVKKSRKLPVTLSLPDAANEYEKVQVKGEMNHWVASSTPLTKTGDAWEVDLFLSPGSYQYLFVADGNEMLDPSNPEKVPNGLGGTNSLLRVGTEASAPVLETKSFSSNKITLSVEGAHDVLALWENYKLTVQITGNSIHISIPGEASEFERSDLRVWAFTDDAVSPMALIPLKNGRVIGSASELTRQDEHAWNMYFVLIDRFKDGNPANTNPVDDPEIHPKANYYGGDLAGITQTIQSGYFDDIGVNTLWLSPITQNPEGAYGFWDQGGPETKFSGYHGYWPVSSSKVDYRFGTEEELRTLIDAAHQNGMNIILDYVANHVHELHPVYQEKPEWATELYLPDGRQNTQLWDEQRLTTWFDTFMPTLDFSKPEVVETMTDSALYWVKNYELDGFRHDATKHIQLEFWRTLTRKIKTQVVAPTGRNIYQIGETYGSRELINSYINSGMLDGQFDFAIFDAAQGAFARGDHFDFLRNQLQQSLDVFGYHNKMGYISGNHDKARFIAYAGGAVSFDEDAKVAGWTREIGIPDTTGYDKLNLLHAFNMTIPGIPVTYYGDEFGMPGANDPDNRRWMRFEEDELNRHERRNRDIFSKLSSLRNNSMPLLYGDFRFHVVEKDVMAYSRAYFGEMIIVVFNKSGEKKQVVFPVRSGYDIQKGESHFGHEFFPENGNGSITLPGHSFEIIKF